MHGLCKRLRMAGWVGLGQLQQRCELSKVCGINTCTWMQKLGTCRNTATKSGRGAEWQRPQHGKARKRVKCQVCVSVVQNLPKGAAQMCAQGDAQRSIRSRGAECIEANSLLG